MFIEWLLWYLGSNFSDEVRPLSVDNHYLKLILNKLEVLLIHQLLVNQVLHDIALKSSKVID